MNLCCLVIYIVETLALSNKKYTMDEFIDLMEVTNYAMEASACHNWSKFF